MTDFKVFQPPVYVGLLVITDDFGIACRTKPSRFHLWAMNKAFGWTWKEL